MGKINVAELLSNCPKGMELDCLLWNNVTFERVADNGIWIKHIDSKSCEHSLYLYNDGSFPIHNLGSLRTKCVIFPKGKTTWEGFVPPCKFKNGDVIFVANNESDEDFQYEYIAIFKEIKRNKDLFVHGFYSYNDDIFSTHPYLCEITNSTRIKFATEEQKEKLFNLIKINGYEWSAKIKTFGDLVEPKFKVGNWVVDNCSYVWKIKGILNQFYLLEGIEGDESRPTIDWVDKTFHLWTIQDAKDGDVLVCDINKAEIGGDVEKLPNIVSTIFIFKNVITSRDYIHSYCHLYDRCFLGLQSTMYYNSFVYNIHPTTKEQRDLLFQKIKEEGYEYNTKTKTFKELPKFKVGCRIKPMGSDRNYIIKNIKFDRYILNDNKFLKFTDEHHFELVEPNKI